MVQYPDPASALAAVRIITRRCMSRPQDKWSTPFGWIPNVALSPWGPTYKTLHFNWRKFSYLQVWVWYRDVVVLSLILRQQFEPATDRTPEDLTHSEWQRSHEVVPGRAVPVPHFHRQSPVPLVTAHWAGETNTTTQSHWGDQHKNTKENCFLYLLPTLWRNLWASQFQRISE